MIVTLMSAVIGSSRLAYWRTTTPAARCTALLVHGLGADHQGLLPMARMWPDIDVVAPDLPGFGKSEPLDVAHSMTNYGRALADLCAHLDLQNLVVIGHSLGANIALTFAAQHPQRVSALVLICPVISGNGFQTRLTRGYYRAGALLPRRAARTWFLSRLAIYLGDRTTLTTRDPLVRRHILDEDYRTAALASPHAIVESYRSLLGTPFTTLATDVRAQTLLIAAERDSLASPGSVATLQRSLPGSKLLVIPDAGHLWPAEAPAAAGRVIAAHVHAP